MPFSSRDIQLLVTEHLPVFVTVFVFKKWFKTGINKLSGSHQWHITFDLKQVALTFQKPLAGENRTSFQMYFKYYKIIGCHGNLVKCRNLVT